MNEIIEGTFLVEPGVRVGSGAFAGVAWDQRPRSLSGLGIPDAEGVMVGVNFNGEIDYAVLDERASGGERRWWFAGVGDVR